MYPVPREKSVEYKKPWLMADWDYVLNKVSPDTVGCGSEYEAHWVCYFCGEAFTQRVNSKNHVGCKKCVKKRMSKKLMLPPKGESLLDVCPDVAAEFVSCDEASGPAYVYPGSNKMATWRCSVNPEHVWRTTIGSRGLEGTGCPYCNRITIGIRQSIPEPGKSLGDLREDVAMYWDYEKNGDITPFDVMLNSNKVRHWKCPVCNNTWTNKVNVQVKRQNQCLFCAGVSNVSFPEKAAYLQVHDIYPDAEENVHVLGRGNGKMELDIYIDSIKTAIEYDGEYWHGLNPDRDRRKDEACAEAGIRLIRIREAGCPDYEGMKAEVVKRDLSKGYAGLDEAIESVMKLLGHDVKVDTKASSARILEAMRLSRIENSFGHNHPELLSEWHPTLNLGLDPFMFSCGSNAMITWVCPNGHEYQATINSRNQGHGCDICARKESGEKRSAPAEGRSLAEMDPFVASEWYQPLNGDVTPKDVAYTSGRHYWFKCSNPECGHIWEAQLSNRTSGKKSGCRKCRYRKMAEKQSKPKPGKSLGDKWPILAEFMLPEKNDGLTAYDVTITSKENHVWTCPSCGEEWVTSCGLMNLRKYKCQKCHYGAS